MTSQQLVVLALQVSVLLTVFGFGLQTTVHELLYLIRRPGLLARSFVAMFVVMPVVAVALVRLFELRPAFEIVLVALAISPVPPLLPKKEGKAGGESAYALGLMAAVSLLAIAVVPLSVEILGRYFARPLQTPPLAVAKVVVIMTLLPLLAGVFVRAAAPAIAERLEKPARLVATVLLILGAGALLVAALPLLASVIDISTLVAIAAFVVVGLAAGHRLGGPEPEHATVLALSTASRHPAIALAVAKINFPNEPYLGVTILLYLLVLAVVTVPYVARQRRSLLPLTSLRRNATHV
jgi:BASS family bile acid:Na+ symporter